MTARISQKALAQEPSDRGKTPQTGFQTLVIASMLLASFGLICLAVRPELDLKGSAVFFQAPHHFIGQAPWARLFRLFAEILPFIVYFIAILAHFRRWLRIGPNGFGPRFRSLVFLTSTLAVGPGLIVNTGLKAHVHRPRPIHVQEFGGQSAFQPFYQIEGGCAKNCSFPSGETAAAFWIAAPAALAPPALRVGLAAAAILFGLLTGLFRMAAGAHFLSDILASGWLMGTIMIALWLVLMRPWPFSSRQKTETGLHEGEASL